MWVITRFILSAYAHANSHLVQEPHAAEQLRLVGRVFFVMLRKYLGDWGIVWLHFNDFLHPSTLQL